MRCLICKRGSTEPGTTTVTLERDGLIMVIKGVPAQVCENCGEAYVDEKVASDVGGGGGEIGGQSRDPRVRDCLGLPNPEEVRTELSSERICKMVMVAVMVSITSAIRPFQNLNRWRPERLSPLPASWPGGWHRWREGRIFWKSPVKAS